jgi:hypothetical protein
MKRGGIGRNTLAGGRIGMLKRKRLRVENLRIRRRTEEARHR